MEITSVDSSHSRLLLEAIVGSIILLSTLYYLFKEHYKYWKKRRVFTVEANFPFGILHDQVFAKADAGTIVERLYSKFKKRGLKYLGTFTVQQPTLIILDLNISKNILAKDFNHFSSRDLSPLTHEFISKHLFGLEGQEWREMRSKLTPTFTPLKIKGMFELMRVCADQLQKHIDKIVVKEEEFDVKDLITRFTIDIIASCAFGCEVNSISNRYHKFFEMGKLALQRNRTSFIKIVMHKYFPKTARVLRLNYFDSRVSKFLFDLMKDTVAFRVENKVTRNDFVDLLMKVRDNRINYGDDNSDEKVGLEKSASEETNLYRSQEKLLTLEEMTAQSFAFFTAGHEAAASATSFSLYELAMNPEVQDKLRREIDEVLLKHGGQLTYQALQDMTYMDQVINETLRRYASLPVLTRVCTSRYQIQGTDLVIDKGVRVNIPTYAIHHDPDIYPDPFKFDPDRFSEENSRERHHYAFLPFGEGPRICVAITFGRLQIKVGLAAILSRYELSPAPDTPLMLELDPLIIVTTSKHPFRLRISRRFEQEVL